MPFSAVDMPDDVDEIVSEAPFNTRHYERCVLALKFDSTDFAISNIIASQSKLFVM